MKKSLWIWLRWILITMTIGLWLGACGTKKIGLTTGEACDNNEQCLSANCVDQAGQQTCQPQSTGKVCSAGSTQSCICSDGKSGNQTCEASGKLWGVCTCTGNPPQKCVPNSTQACTCADGKSGNQSCNADGQAYGSCTCTGAPLCTPGGTQACICPTGQQGSQSCNADGKSWAACQCQGTTGCTPGSTQACTCAGGQQGSQACNADGKSWATCQCGTANVCTPGGTQACTCADGKSGSQSCNADGKSWAACQCQGNPQGKAIGTPCQESSECQGGQCIEKSGGSPYCSQRCTSTDCPAGYACADFDENTQVCGKIRPNSQPYNGPCTNLFDCQSLFCWRGLCSQRCEVNACPGGTKCVKFHKSLKFCSSGACDPANFNAAVECSKSCQDAACIGACQNTHMSQECQSCYTQFAQCVANTGCDSNSPTCCAAQQKACFGGA